MSKTAEECHAYLARVIQTVSPGIVPLEDLAGVCTQVDHLLATQREALCEAEARGRAEGIEIGTQEGYEAGARDMRTNAANLVTLHGLGKRRASLRGTLEHIADKIRALPITPEKEEEHG